MVSLRKRLANLWPRRHSTELVDDAFGNTVGLYSSMKPVPWIEFEYKHGVGVGILGIWLLAGRDVWGDRNGFTFEYRHRLLTLDIRLPSLTMRQYANGQWGGVPHWYRPQRTTTIYFRLGQQVQKIRVDDRGRYVRDKAGKLVFEEPVATWCIDLGQADQLFDAIKFVMRRHLLYAGLRVAGHGRLAALRRTFWFIQASSRIGSGQYTIIGKLNYRRSNNHEQPHDFDSLYWGDTCILQNLD
jgi:hypothetical protein